MRAKAIDKYYQHDTAVLRELKRTWHLWAAGDGREGEKNQGGAPQQQAAASVL